MEISPPQDPTAPQKVSNPQKADKPASRGKATQQKSAPPSETSSPLEPEADPLPQNISQNWEKVKTVVRQSSPQVQALLNSCKLLGIKGHILILGCNGEFTKSKLEQPENMEILQQAMLQVMGENMPVRCVMSAGKSIPPDVDQDGMVATALRDLGGEIVDIQ